MHRRHLVYSFIHFVRLKQERNRGGGGQGDGDRSGRAGALCGGRRSGGRRSGGGARRSSSDGDGACSGGARGARNAGVIARVEVGRALTVGEQAGTRKGVGVGRARGHERIRRRVCRHIRGRRDIVNGSVNDILLTRSVIVRRCFLDLDAGYRSGSTGNTVQIVTRGGYADVKCSRPVIVRTRRLDRASSGGIDLAVQRNVLAHDYIAIIGCVRLRGHSRGGGWTLTEPGHCREQNFVASGGISGSSYDPGRVTHCIEVVGGIGDAVTTCKVDPVSGRVFYDSNVGAIC